MPTYPELVYRDASRRGHRLLGTYLAISAWALKIEYVALSRKTLLGFLKLERMRNKRVDWMREDIKDLFPRTQTLYYSSTRCRRRSDDAVVLPV